MKYIKTFESFGKSDNNVEDMYNKFGKIFPLAADLIAYYIFNYKESDNSLLKQIEKHANELSELTMGYENSWEDNMEDIEIRVKEIIYPTESNESVKTSEKNVIDILIAIGKIEQIFDDEYITNLKAMVDNNKIDKRLLDHANITANDFAALKSWANQDFNKQTLFNTKKMKATHVTFYLIEFENGKTEIQNVNYCTKKQSEKFIENSKSSVSSYPYEIAMTMKVEEFETYKEKINE